MYIHEKYVGGNIRAVVLSNSIEHCIANTKPLSKPMLIDLK